MDIDTEISEAVEQSYRLLHELEDQTLDELLEMSRLLLDQAQALINRVADERERDATMLRDARALVQQANAFRHTRLYLNSPLIGRTLTEDDARDDEPS